MTSTSRTAGAVLVAQCGDLRGVGGEFPSRRRTSAMRSLANSTRIRSVTSIVGHDLLSGIFRPLGRLLLHVGQLLYLVRLRALAGSFAANQSAFHDRSGRGYRFLADLVIEADALNPQVAARLVPPLGRWRRFVEPYSGLMRAELERIVATPGLSTDVFEQASRSLG